MAIEKLKKPKVFILRSFIIGQLRRTFRRYAPYYETLNEAKETYYLPTKKGGKKKRVKFRCSNCKEQFTSKEIIVDHIIPVIDPVTGFPINPDGTDNWNIYLYRLFCPKSNLQVLCKACHNIKCGKEIKTRVKSRKKKLDNS